MHLEMLCKSSVNILDLKVHFQTLLDVMNIAINIQCKSSKISQHLKCFKLLQMTKSPNYH